MTDAASVALDDRPLPKDEPATLKVLDDGWNTIAGQYEVSACAWAERHTSDGQCAYDLGRRGYRPRLIPVNDPETGRPLLDESGKEFVMSADPRNEAHVPAVTVPESLANLKRHVGRRLAAEADAVVATARAKEKG